VIGKVRSFTRRNKHRTLAALLRRLNPVLRGWCNYFRHGVSSRTFNYLDNYAWWRVVRCGTQTPRRSELGHPAPPDSSQLGRSATATSHWSAPIRSPFSATATGASRSRRHGRARNELVESRMHGDVLVRFGGRAEETDRLKGQHRASVRPLHEAEGPGEMDVLLPLRDPRCL
jgi:Group II intron, maturase-specific domain